jgi:putative ABC transport system permease protein
VEPVEELVQSLTPDLVTSRLASVTVAYPSSPSDPTPFVTAVKPGCPVLRAVMDTQFGPRGPVCTILGTNGQSSIAVLAAADIARLASLDAADAAVLSGGGIMVRDTSLITQGTVTMASGTARMRPGDGTAESVSGTVLHTLPAVVGKLPLQPGQYGGAVTPETAQRLGWKVGSYSLLLRNPDGPISRADEQALSDQLSEEGGMFVERGFQREDKVIMQVMFAAFGLLLLIVTLISTALALAEQQGDMGTLAAVGATKGTRRRLAAAQAATVAFIGVLVGIAVGLAPGIAVTYPLTGFSYDPETGRELTPDPITIIPWLPLALLLVGVPLVAALLSAAAIRRAPTMTRRAD